MAFNGRNSPTLRRHRQQGRACGRKPQLGSDKTWKVKRTKVERRAPRVEGRGPRVPAAKEHHMRTLLSRLSLMVALGSLALYLPAVSAHWPTGQLADWQLRRRRKNGHGAIGH